MTNLGSILSLILQMMQIFPTKSSAKFDQSQNIGTSSARKLTLLIRNLHTTIVVLQTSYF
ncbi:hypothetical protein LNP04_13985 [Chryseobacterium sp. C-71]|uniref:hypothetical protein n=1 Tax=Chryseobacterium sp. C-71 TaxID=2893882 RepID=UPI001E509136|nr:hypothetical protein [Chryseobacterium sp. C-71]UFH31078.1 hypothetical protein LNP04_13985 [Chryseobacterium sp. C-71]